jgi:hypothetical protein
LISIPPLSKIKNITIIWLFNYVKIPIAFAISGFFFCYTEPDDSAIFHFDFPPVLGLKGKIDKPQEFGYSHGLIILTDVGCYHPNLLFQRICDPEYNVPITIQCDGMPNCAAEELNGDFIVIIFGIDLQGKVMTTLFCNIPREPGITGDFLQGTINAIVVHDNIFLKIARGFAEQVSVIIFRVNGDAD